ncbi:CS1 type fimbrial major subunit [Pseudomonas sp. FP2338]|uniref:CS1 type fimbrial major subunit n=1 Tax=Pseudomonas sp. FP2338 TaxID=2954093 RepID=UPI0027343514|nr:CS1 type fimbrial major subunit [Pseudomonas sp. FP2338]WLH85920.1 CS1 type fimbrial major subunit [Pseudomonas sp. FP2338]
MNQVALRLPALLLCGGLALLSFSAIAAREEAVFHVSVKVPTNDFYVLAVNPGFVEREQVMSYNTVTGQLSALREHFDVKNARGGIQARLSYVPVLSNGPNSIALNVTFNGHPLDLDATLVVPEDEARAGKRVPLVIAAVQPEDGFVPGDYFGSVQIMFDALSP